MAERLHEEAYICAVEGCGREISIKRELDDDHDFDGDLVPKNECLELNKQEIKTEDVQEIPVCAVPWCFRREGLVDILPTTEAIDRMNYMLDNILIKEEIKEEENQRIESLQTEAKHHSWTEEYRLLCSSSKGGKRVEAKEKGGRLEEVCEKDKTWSPPTEIEIPTFVKEEVTLNPTFAAAVEKCQLCSEEQEKYEEQGQDEQHHQHHHQQQQQTNNHFINTEEENTRRLPILDVMPLEKTWSPPTEIEIPTFAKEEVVLSPTIFKEEEVWHQLSEEQEYDEEQRQDQKLQQEQQQQQQLLQQHQQQQQHLLQQQRQQHKRRQSLRRRQSRQQPQKINIKLEEEFVIRVPVVTLIPLEHAGYQITELHGRKVATRLGEKWQKKREGTVSSEVDEERTRSQHRKVETSPLIEEVNVSCRPAEQEKRRFRFATDLVTKEKQEERTNFKFPKTERRKGLKEPIVLLTPLEECGYRITELNGHKIVVKEGARQHRSKESVVSSIPIQDVSAPSARKPKRKRLTKANKLEINKCNRVSPEDSMSSAVNGVQTSNSTSMQLPYSKYFSYQSEGNSHQENKYSFSKRQGRDVVDTVSHDLRCSSCPQSFSLKLSLINHVFTHIDGVQAPQHICNICCNIFSTTGSLTRHCWNNKECTAAAAAKRKHAELTNTQEACNKDASLSVHMLENNKKCSIPKKIVDDLCNRSAEITGHSHIQRDKHERQSNIRKTSFKYSNKPPILEPPHTATVNTTAKLKLADPTKMQEMSNIDASLPVYMAGNYKKYSVRKKVPGKSHKVATEPACLSRIQRDDHESKIDITETSVQCASKSPVLKAPCTDTVAADKWKCAGPTKFQDICNREASASIHISEHNKKCSTPQKVVSQPCGGLAKLTSSTHIQKDEHQCKSDCHTAAGAAVENCNLEILTKMKKKCNTEVSLSVHVLEDNKRHSVTHDVGGIPQETHTKLASPPHIQRDQHECKIDNNDINLQSDSNPLILKCSNNKKCGICNKTFFTSYSLKEHRRVHTGEKLYSCNICGMAFTHQSNLNRHVKAHSVVKPHKCKVCGRAFVSRVHLAKHTKVNKKEPHRCCICGKTFRLSSSFYNHAVVHSTEKPFKCNECGKSFNFRCNLKQHIHTHTESYKCGICFRSFPRLISLRKHPCFSDSEYRPYTCSFCGKSFSKSAGLKQHEDIHKHKHPFKCDICDKKFRTPAHLKLHEVMHSEEKPYKCDKCGKEFKRRPSAIRHLTSVCRME